MNIELNFASSTFEHYFLIGIPYAHITLLGVCTYAFTLTRKSEECPTLDASIRGSNL